MKIVKQDFPENQYYKQEMPKRLIVLHHTVSGAGVAGDVNWWKQTTERVGTPFVIARDGTITQVFDEKYWIHHLGIRQYMLNQFGSTVSNNRLDQLSIGIELDSWGGLIRKDGKWISAVGSVIPDCDVVQYPQGFRGFTAFERYTPSQIDALKQLLQHLGAKWGISLKYQSEMWEFNRKAIVGTHGVWTHVSYRPDKSDCHPQIELIEMLKSLT